MAINPVVIDASILGQNLVVLKTQLHEWKWKNEIVGYNSEGILVVTEKISRKGYYEFPAHFVPVTDFKACSLRPHLSVATALLGLASIAYGCLMFYSVWIAKTYPIHGVHQITGPFVFIPCGLFFIFGIRRVRLSISDGDKWYIWTSSPFDKNRQLVKNDWAIFIQRCSRCGYDLRGSGSWGSCPQCGTPVGGNGPPKPFAGALTDKSR